MLRVVIAEDDLMIADSAEDILVENEYQVCGIARTVMRSPCNHPMYDPGTAAGWLSVDIHAPTWAGQ
jgi:hypothetical protein